jgi:hypothetical protein
MVSIEAIANDGGNFPLSSLLCIPYVIELLTAVFVPDLACPEILELMIEPSVISVI